MQFLREGLRKLLRTLSRENVQETRMDDRLEQFSLRTKPLLIASVLKQYGRLTVKTRREVHYNSAILNAHLGVSLR
jgi:hypothetical protein